MNKFVSQIFRKAGVNAKVSKDPSNVRFKVVDGRLTLEGALRNDRYVMSIKDAKGKKIDSLSVSVQNSNDIVNRINESVNTLKLLSGVYEEKALKEEDEEFDTVTPEDEESPQGQTVEEALTDVYNNIMDIAEFTEGITDLVDENDPESKNVIISFASTLYDIAIDIDDYLEELHEQELEGEEELEEESVMPKTDMQKLVNTLSMCEAILLKNKKYRDIRKAMKDIKSEIVVRG